MKENFTISLNFENTGRITIRRFDYENDKMFLERVNKIILLFLEEDLK